MTTRIYFRNLWTYIWVLSIIVLSIIVKMKKENYTELHRSHGDLIRRVTAIELILSAPTDEPE